MDPTSQNATLGTSKSAQKRPHFGVEEVPSQAAPVIPESPPVIETIPPIPHTEFDRPPAPEQMPAQTQTPAQPAGQPVSSPHIPSPPVSTSNLPPNGHNVVGKGHSFRKLLFLIPVVLLVATIFLVARFTGNSFTVREPEIITTPTPTEEPIEEATPTPTPKSVKKYINQEMLVEMMVPEDYEVLAEDAESTSFGREGTEIFIVRTDEFTNHDDEDETLEVLVGGREAIELNLADEGSVPVRVVQTINDPRYEFVMFLEESALSSEFQKILDSVVFLVDTSDWVTFDNTSYNYKISYPPQWEEQTELAERDQRLSNKTEISKNPENKELNTLVIQTSANVSNAALTASEIISSTRTLSGWTSPPRIELKKLGGGDAQVIQGELSGKWRAYVVIWYKNTVIQMTWDDNTGQGEQKTFEAMLSSFEFTI